MLLAREVPGAASILTARAAGPAAAASGPKGEGGQIGAADVEERVSRRRVKTRAATRCPVLAISTFTCTGDAGGTDVCVEHDTHRARYRPATPEEAATPARPCGSSTSRVVHTTSSCRTRPSSCTRSTPSSPACADEPIPHHSEGLARGVLYLSWRLITDQAGG